MTREQAIRLLKGKAYVFYGEMQLKALGMAIEALEQEPKRGKWVDDDNSFYANCSECGYQIDTHEERGYHNFCSNCGARMESEE